MSYARTAGTDPADQTADTDNAPDDDEGGDEYGVLPPPGMTLESLRAAGIETDSANALPRPKGTPSLWYHLMRLIEVY